jgi:hypothetical protein
MKRKRHTPEEIIKKLREAATLLAAGQGVEEARQPVAERLQRKLQQPLPRRVPQPRKLRLGAGGESARQATSASP